MANKRKTTTAIVAGVTAVALLLGGTFAWTSISQQAKNEAIVDINPGGRLHDDFNGTNKDVYVENFGDEKTGVPIFARIRLYEYMEIGQQAGNKTIADGERKADSLINGDTIGDTAGWEIYKYGETSAFTKYWSWKLGNNDETTLPYYMPTFNLNKDSLAADINGTYEGTVNDDIVHYDDYIQYGEGSTKTDTEVYDHDSNTNEEEEGTATDGVPAYSTTDPNAPIDDAHVRLNENQEHKAEQISTTSIVMSMEEWIAAGSQPGPIWVFDTDGWAYWAQPIAPGETTGLLLDSIQMTRVPDDSWYYGINVVAQFATEGDISAFGNGATEEQTWTSDAEELFVVITEAESAIITGSDTVEPGSTATFTATRTVGGVTASKQPTFTWTATDADEQSITGVEISADGTLSVAEDVADGTKITVTATATMEADGEGEATVLSATKVVTVKPYETPEITVADQNGITSTIIGEVGYDSTYMEFEVPNTHNQTETYVITLNREIDQAATMADASYAELADAGVTVEFVDNNTLRVTFTGQELNGIIHDDNGITHYIVKFYVHTDKEKIDLTFYEALVEDTDIQVQYVQGDTLSELPSELKVGDQIVAWAHGDEKYFNKWSYSSTTMYAFYDAEGNLIHLGTLEDDAVECKVTATDNCTDTIKIYTVPDAAEGAVKVKVVMQAAFTEDYPEHRRYVYNEFNISVIADDETT